MSPHARASTTRCSTTLRKRSPTRARAASAARADARVETARGIDRRLLARVSLARRGARASRGDPARGRAPVRARPGSSRSRSSAVRPRLRVVSSHGSLAAIELIEHVEMFYRLTSDAADSSCACSPRRRAARSRSACARAQLEFHYEIEHDDARRSRRGVFPSTPAVTASVRFSPDYERGARRRDAAQRRSLRVGDARVRARRHSTSPRSRISCA